MTIVYDSSSYRTLVSRPGEVPYKFWSVNKFVIDAAASGFCTLEKTVDPPVTTTVLWLDLSNPEIDGGVVKAWNGSSWVALTKDLFLAHLGGGASAWGAITGTLSAQTDLQAALDAKVTGSGTSSGSNTGDVTLAGTPNYLTIAGQVITRALIDLAAHVTGKLPLANMADVATATVFYRKTAATGVPEVQTLATLKTDLGLTGTNGGDQTSIVGITGSIAQFNAAITDGDLATGGGTATGANTADVTLAGAPTYLTIAGQVITRALIDLASHVTGRLPFANLTQGSARSVLGVTGNAAADAASIQGTADQVLRVDTAGTGLAFGTVATAGIANAAVTLAKMADVATETVFYRKTAATGVPEVQTLATLKTDLGLTGTNSGDQTITLTTDVTGSGTGSFAATLATVNANTGSWGLAASVAQFTVNAKGLITAAANVAISIASTAISDSTVAGRAMLTAATAAAQTALLNAFVGDAGAGGTKGMVPAPITGDATKFLRGDGTFVAIPGGGDALVANPLSQFAATTSLQLKNNISDETGAGALVFADAPALSAVALAAGTAALDPLTFTAGTNLTTALAGAMEYDGKVPYFTPQSTQRGVIPGMQFFRLNADLAGANAVGAQNILGKSVSLSAGTVYAFELFFTLQKTAGTTSHTVSIGWGGTSTVNNYGALFKHNIAAVAPNANIAVNHMWRATPALLAMTGAITTASTQYRCRVQGTISIGAAGTFIPQYSLSAAPGGAYSTLIGSSMLIYPIGASGADNNVGTWA